MIAPDHAYLHSADIFRSVLRIEPALEAALGDDHHPQGFRATFHRMYPRPGKPATASFIGHFLCNGRQEEAYIIATNGDIRAQAAHREYPYGCTEVDGLSISAWRFPMDPALPALAEASTPTIVGRWLTQAGLLLDNEQFAVHVEEYRPCESARIRVAVSEPSQHDHYFTEVEGIVESYRQPVYIEHPQRTLSIVVVAPEQAEYARASLSAASNLGQRILTSPRPGVYILSSISGARLLDQLARYTHAHSAVSTLPRIEALLDRLPTQPVQAQSSPALADRLHDYCQEIARQDVLHTSRPSYRNRPSPSSRLDHLAKEISSCACSGHTPPIVATYGDFSPENIIFHPSGTPSGLRASLYSGTGYREDDLATLFAHMIVLPLSSPTKYHGIRGLTEKWIKQAAHTHHPARLYAKIAAGIIALAAYTSQELTHLYLCAAEELTRRAHHARSAQDLHESH